MTDTTQGDQVQQEAEADDPETVALATEMGWKDPSQWKGDPPKGGHLTATEFVRRGEKILPIVNARARKAEERAAKLEQELDNMRSEHRDTVKRIERMSTAAIEQTRLRTIAEYTAKKEAAVEVGDKEAYRQADKDEREAIKAMDDRLKENDKKDDDKPEKRELPREVKAIIDDWISDNQWFNTNKRMNSYANTIHMELQEDKPGLSLRENLAEVRKEVIRRFPEAFGAKDDEEEEDDPPRRRGSPVEGGSRLGGAGGGSKFSKLPAEAKAACDKFIKEDRLFLEPGETPEKNLNQARERYATQYLEDSK